MIIETYNNFTINKWKMTDYEEQEKKVDDFILLWCLCLISILLCP